MQSEVSTTSNGLRYYIGGGLLSFLKSTVNTAVNRIFWSISFHLLLTGCMYIVISFSSNTWNLSVLSKVPKVGSMSMELLSLIGQQGPWPKPKRKSMGFCKEDERHQTQQLKMTWRQLSEQAGLPIHRHRATGGSLGYSDLLRCNFISY